MPTFKVIGGIMVGDIGSSMGRLTQKQETFTQNLFKGMSQRDAWIQAGYSSSYASAIIDTNACKLANSNKIQLRWGELQKKAEDALIATVKERKQILSGIARANIPDYINDAGIKVEKESPNVGAVSEITTKTKIYRKGTEPINITNLKLHNPIPAIAELNKMEKIYSEGTTLNIDNRKVEIIVSSDTAKKLTEAILNGEGT